MDLAVVDTTVLSNFAQVGKPRLVKEAFPKLGAPRGILNELRRGQALGVLPAGDWGWLPLLRPNAAEARQAKRFQQRLDLGEAGCLAIAVSRNAMLLTDDRAARSMAVGLGIQVSGTLGVLVKLVDLGHLSDEKADSLLERMIQFGYWSPVRSLREL